MKVLLIYANFIRTPRPALPIGMAYIAAALTAAGHRTETLDLCFKRKYNAAVIEKLKETKPDIVGISFRNLDNVTFLEPESYIGRLRRIVQCCRKYAKAPVVIGGTGFSVEPEGVMEYAKPDYGLTGEGETSFVKLLDLLQRKEKELSSVPGLVYRKNGEIQINPPDSAIDLNRNLIPDRRIYEEEYYEEILAPGTDKKNDVYPAYETVQGKRGCGLRCSYCVIRKVQGEGVRVREPKLVVEEIREILRKNPLAEEIEFVDATFNYPYEHAVALCREIIASGLSFHWNCEISPVNVTPELVELMEKSGCTRVELGTDSVSDEGLISLQKGFDFAQVRYVDELFSRSSILFTHCIFFGAPGETPEVIRLALKRLELLKADQIFITLGIRVYRHTLLYERAVLDGLADEGQSAVFPTFYVEPELMKDEDILDEIQDFIENRESWYLYWGLSHTRLKDLARDAAAALQRMRRENKEPGI